MISAYYRPKTIQEALKQLSIPDTVPLGGGTVLSQETGKNVSVVDLQLLGLDKIRKRGNVLEIGAAVTLTHFAENDISPKPILDSIKHEASPNIRNIGTIAGHLVVCDGRSALATSLLAMDARLKIETSVGEEHSITISLGDFLPQRNQILPNRLITGIEIPLNIKMAYESVARSPMDKPLVCAALVLWPSKRTRLALGGWGELPLLAFDGNEPSGISEAARNAYSDAQDEWASKEYRSDIASVLVARCFEKLT